MLLLGKAQLFPGLKQIYTDWACEIHIHSLQKQPQKNHFQFIHRCFPESFLILNAF